MPDAFEFPGMLRAVVPLMRGQRRFFGVVDKFVALANRKTSRTFMFFTGFCARLEPGLAAVVRALDDLSEPAARLRGINYLWVRWRALNMINFPSGKMRTVDLPRLSFAV